MPRNINTGRTEAVVKSRLRKDDIYNLVLDEMRALFKESARSWSIRDVRWKQLAKNVGEKGIEIFKKAVIASHARIHQDSAGSRVPHCHTCYFWKRTGAKWGECINDRWKIQVLPFDPYKVGDRKEVADLAAKKQIFTQDRFGCNFGIRRSQIQM